MSTIDKWAERIYAESDFGRSVATSSAAAIGLVLYLTLGDWVVAVFSAIIVFPIARLLAGRLHNRADRRAKQRLKQGEAEEVYDGLSDTEKEVVRAFVDAGGTALTLSQVNRLPLSRPAIETLMQRKILWCSMTADGMRETFALDTTIYDVCRERNKAAGGGDLG